MTKIIQWPLIQWPSSRGRYMRIVRISPKSGGISELFRYKWVRRNCGRP